MKGFKIIPVIDILNSKVVHAKKGERDKYRPLKSPLFQTDNPIEIVKVIKRNFDLNTFYIADLDSIIKKKPNIQIIKEISKISDIKIILDPGIIGLEDITYFSELNIKSLILGLETISNFEIISLSLQLLNKERIIISIDMYQGKILSRNKDLQSKTPLGIVKEIETLGITNIILLDLSRVGQKIGGIPSLYRNISENFNGNIIIGGGIKSFEDILNYKNKNFSGVLIATALYDGTIKSEKIRNFY